jgi:hypothetical protein
MVENDDLRKREVDLDRHLRSEPEKGQSYFGSEVSADDDYMMYQALMLLKAASILSPRQVNSGS